MDNRFSRTELLLGKGGMEKLKKSRVAVFGVGGVGGYAAEALVRSGVGSIDIFDPDTVSQTNINRQIIALTSTIGKLKVEVLRDRMLDINPQCCVKAYPVFYSEENQADYPLSYYNYVIDCIDSVQSKATIILNAEKEGVKIISSMGAGNKLDPTAFKVADIYKTKVCPLARVMRNKLSKLGIKKLKVVYSEEPPLKAVADDEKNRHAPGSIATVPSVAGLIIASEVISDLLK